MGTLKPHGKGPLKSNTVIGTLVVDGWAVTFPTARRSMGGLWSLPVLALHRRRSIGVHGVRTPPVFGLVVSTHRWTPPEFATT